MPSANVKLTEGSVMRHVTVMSFTSSIGIMAIYLVDLFDIFFISLLGHEEVAAAAGYASTLLFFVSAVNIGLSIGAGALIAQALGRDDDAGARDVTTSSAAVAVAVGIVLPILMFPALPFLIELLGAEGEVADMAIGYLVIVLPATALSGMSMVFVAAIRADGAAGWAMYPALLGATINLVFDPLLIFGLGMDLPGAATATVLARCGTFALALYAVTRKFNLVSRFNISTLRTHIAGIVFYSVPAVISNVASPIAMAILMRYITKFGPEAVAGMAIVGRLSPVVFSVVNALSGAIGAILGQNYGAGLYDRVRRAYFDAIKFLAIYVAVVILLLMLLQVIIADAFSAQGLAREMIYIFCGPFALIAFFNGILFIATAAFNSLGRPQLAPRLIWIKSTIGQLAFISLGSQFFGMQGLAYGLVCNAALFCFIAHQMTMRIFATLSDGVVEDASENLARDAHHVRVQHGKSMHT